MTESGHVVLPPTGVPTVADAAARLAFSTQDGGLVVQLDTDELYVYNARSNTWILVSSSFTSFASTNSISVTNTGGTLSANLNLSSAGATGSSVAVANTILSDGLQSQVPRGTLTSSTSGVTVGGTGYTLGNNLTVNVATASGSQNGLLSSTDWTTFNGKQAAGNYITGLTGDVVATGPGSVTGTIQANAVTQGKVSNGYVDLSSSQSVGGTKTFTANPQVSTPSGGNDAVNKSYVDNLINGIAWKASVRAATTANITLLGTQTIDGVALSAGDRVLVKDQAVASQNGIYVVAAGAWARSADAATGSQLVAASVFVDEGTVNIDSGFLQTTPSPITVGLSSIVWTKNFGTGAYSADGTTLTLSGSVFSIASGGVSNSQVASSAGIAVSKLAALPVSKPVRSDASGFLTTGNTALGSEVSGTLPIANGGTNKTSFTDGSVIFYSSSGTSFNENNGQFFWDNTNNRLTLGGSPGTATLNVTGSGSTTLANFYTTSSNNAFQIQHQNAYGLQITNANSGTQQGATLGFASSRGTLTSRTQRLAGDLIGSFTFQGYTGSVFGPGFSGAVFCYATENQTSTANGGALVFAPTPNGTLTPVTALTMNQDTTITLASLSASLPVKTNGSKTLVSAAINLASGTEVTGTVATGNGGTGLASIGTANQVLSVNTGATGLEYKTVTAGSGISVTPATGTLTVANSQTADGTTLQLVSNTYSVKAGGISNTQVASGAAIAVNKLAALTVSSPVRSDASGFLTTGVTSLTSEVSGVLPIANGGTSLSSLGSANQVLGVNNAGTSAEYKTIAAGTGVTVTNTAGTITIASTSGTTQTVTTASGTSVTVSTTSNQLVRLTNTSARTVTLPTAPSDGTVLYLKDAARTSATAAITINRGGSDTIDGSTSTTINSNGGSLTLVYSATGTNWEII